jgi:hypothetical protein
MSEDEFNGYIGEVREYRDKFVAHLDSEETMRPPVLEVVKNSASCLYDYLLAHEDEGDYFFDAPARSSSTFYASVLNQVASAYSG